MSYAEQLKAHYKATRERMRMNAVCKPVQVMRLPPPTLPPKAEPGLVSESQSEAVVKDALAVTYAQAKEEADKYPLLPPLPGLVLNEVGAVRWMRILHAVAQMHKVDAQEILSASRKRHIVNARFELFYRMRTDLAMSYTKIGTLTKRDHTTIMHGVWKVRQKILDADKAKAENEHLAASNTCRGKDAHTPITVGG